MEKKNQVLEFFETCQQNKTKLIKQKNLIIDKLLRIKKNNSSKEEYLDYRDALNKKRIETSDEKNRRECEEMLDEMKEEKKIVQEMTMNMIKVKKEVEEVIKNGKVDECVKSNDYNDLVSNFNILVNQHNEMLSNYVKRSELNQIQQFNNGNNQLIYQQYPQQNYQNIPGYQMQQPPQQQYLQPIIPQQLNNNIAIPMKPPMLPPQNRPLKQAKLTPEEQKQFEEWTGLQCSDIVFDSNVDNWSKDTSVFNERIIGKKQLVFLIEDEDGEKFGYYLNTQVIEKYGKWIETDKKSFHFNLITI